MLGTKGKGVFSSVVLCVDEDEASPLKGQEVAIKVLRGNELMLRAGVKEAALLRELTAGEDGGGAQQVRVWGGVSCWG